LPVEDITVVNALGSTAEGVIETITAGKNKVVPCSGCACGTCSGNIPIRNLLPSWKPGTGPRQKHNAKAPDMLSLTTAEWCYGTTCGCLKNCLRQPGIDVNFILQVCLRESFVINYYHSCKICIFIFDSH
jgi:hypothetical protein